MEGDFSQKKIPARETCLKKKILQAVVPKKKSCNGTDINSKVRKKVRQRKNIQILNYFTIPIGIMGSNSLSSVV